MKKNKKSKSGGKLLAAGVGAALGAGAYYLLGPDGKKNQKRVSILMGKIKKEVEKEVKKSKEVSTPLYHKVVDVVSENYAKQYKIHEPEIKAFTKKLKSEWKNVSKKVAPKVAKIIKKKK